MIDNFLRPRLVGERAKLHELFIFFAVLGGLQVFGILGIVLGPVVLAIALALFDGSYAIVRGHNVVQYEVEARDRGGHLLGLRLP